MSASSFLQQLENGAADGDVDIARNEGVRGRMKGCGEEAVGKMFPASRAVMYFKFLC